LISLDSKPGPPIKPVEVITRKVLTRSM